ncbi:MAG: hypothetical protein WC004_02235 [Candidatus Absconditabacterales bacterium]
MLLSSLFAFLGDYFAKTYSVDRQLMMLVVCLVSFLIGDILFVVTLFQREFVLMNVIWNTLNISLGLIIGFVLFHEQVTTLQGVGIIISIVGLILMSIE